MELKILLIIAIIFLLVLSRRERFSSFESDFIQQTGKMRFDQPSLTALAQKLKQQIDDTAQTGNKIPQKESFVRTLGLEPNYIITDDEYRSIRMFFNRIFENIVKVNNATVIEQLQKHEDNHYSFIFYIEDPDMKLYYGRVKALIQLQNNDFTIHSLKFQGLVTPLSVQQIDSIEDVPKKNYAERERTEPKFLSEQEVKEKVKEFDRRKENLMLLMNIQARYSNEALKDT